MKNKLKLIGVILAGLLVLALTVTMVTENPAVLAQERKPGDAQIEQGALLTAWKNYTVPFTLEGFYEYVPALTGDYMTTIKMYNYSQKTVYYVKKVILTQRQCSEFGDVSPWVWGWIPPVRGVEIDKYNIGRYFACEAGQYPYANGFVHIASSLPIDIAAIYTGVDKTSNTSGTGFTMDVEKATLVTLSAPAAMVGTPATIETSYQILPADEYYGLDAFVIVSIRVLTSAAQPVPNAVVDVSVKRSGPVVSPTSFVFPKLYTDEYGELQFAWWCKGATSDLATIKVGTKTAVVEISWVP